MDQVFTVGPGCFSFFFVGQLAYVGLLTPGFRWRVGGRRRRRSPFFQTWFCVFRLLVSESVFLFFLIFVWFFWYFLQIFVVDSLTLVPQKNGSIVSPVSPFHRFAEQERIMRIERQRKTWRPRSWIYVLNMFGNNSIGTLQRPHSNFIWVAFVAMMLVSGPSILLWLVPRRYTSVHIHLVKSWICVWIFLHWFKF